MNSKWQRLARIFPGEHDDWGMTHASVPFAIYREGDNIVETYFSARDSSNRSFTSSFRFDAETLEVVEFGKNKLFEPGKRGLFDDSGVTMSCALQDKNLYYYMGWSLSKTVPFSNEIGLARKSSSCLGFRRYSPRPILGKCEKEPLSFGYPWVLCKDGVFYMWYDTILEWSRNSSEDYKFHLRAAVSTDGREWNKVYKVHFPLGDNERAIARPCVLYDKGIFRMWFSIDVAGKYRLGYAESEDGFFWERMDFTWEDSPERGEWESSEQSYPFVFNLNNQRYMLYNGNCYGKTGIGIAVEV